MYLDPRFKLRQFPLHETEDFRSEIHSFFYDEYGKHLVSIKLAGTTVTCKLNFAKVYNLIYFLLLLS